MGLLDVNSIMAETLVDSIPKTRPIDDKPPEQNTVSDDVVNKEQEEHTDLPTTEKPENSEVGESDDKIKQTIEHKPKRQPAVVHSEKSKSDYIQIKNFPRGLMSAVRSEFPTASNNTDALAAYVYTKTNVSGNGVPQNIKDLAATYDGNRAVENMEKRMSSLEKQVRDMMNLLKEVELAISYVTFDRLGFRRDNPKDMRSVDFLENGVTDIVERLREQTNQLKQQENIKNGRPIR